ncbi:MAG: AmmeMemoRadiSam system protein B [Anaerohalosphaeraceae bacterium]
MIRKPAVAGQFYSASRSGCLSEIEDCLPRTSFSVELPNPIVAGIVPHAGWVFSGDLAAMVFQAVRQVNGTVDTFVLFGASHRYGSGVPAVYDKGAWETPLGLAHIDEDLAAKVVALGASAKPAAHLGEHSIEVQIPFIQYLFPEAQIVPILMPLSGFEVQFGQEVGRLLNSIRDKKTVCIASTDLTHYGPRYGFCPQGIGSEAIEWAHRVNDGQFINLALQMKADQIVSNACENQNACGPAAAAALVAAARARGASKGVLLAHTNSRDVMLQKFRQRSEESVGYAAIVF